jgi:hypothetical protein
LKNTNQSQNYFDQIFKSLKKKTSTSLQKVLHLKKFYTSKSSILSLFRNSKFIW